MLDPTLYVILLIILGVIALTTFIPIAGLLYIPTVVILAIIFQWDASLIVILMIIVTIVNIAAAGVAVIGAIPTGGLSLTLLLQYIPTLIFAGIIGFVYFIIAIFQFIGVIFALELSIGAGIVGVVSLLGIGIIGKKAKASPRTCITINDNEPVCYGKY